MPETQGPPTDSDARRRQLYRLLGPLPDQTGVPLATVIGTERRDSYEIEHLVLDLNGIEPVPAYFVRPRGSGTQPLPAVLYNHAHGGNMVLGKDELLDGRPSLQRPPYAEALTQAGYTALCIDMWGFGERRGRSLDATFKAMLWRGRVLWGMMVADTLGALRYLAARPDVDEQRMATLGLSMGSTMAWWIAALSPAIEVCVDLCCLTDFETLTELGDEDLHGVYYYVPDLLNHFSTSDINSLIAPRAHLSLAGRYDQLTPAAGLDVIDTHLQAVYAAHDRPQAWRLSRYPCGHLETHAMRAEVLAFLETWL